MRIPRIIYPGSLHHVMNRGLRHEVVFLDDECCIVFIGLLATIPRQFGVQIHGYALMPNHFHLLVENQVDGLPRAMQKLQGEYAAWFNFRFGFDGPLWKGRYRDKVVQSEPYWRHAAVYIHENPVRAGLVNHPDAARWTSHAAYTGASPTPGWLTTGPLLASFGSRGEYVAYLEDSRMNRFDPPSDFDPNNLWDVQIPEDTDQIRVSVSLDVAMDILAEAMHLPHEQFSNPNPANRDNVPRWIALDWLPRATGLSQAKVAKALGARPEQIVRARRLLARRVIEDEAVEEICANLDRLLIGNRG